jgi:hypothetical protein
MIIYNMLRREGYLKSVKRIIETSYPDHSMYPVENHQSGLELYRYRRKIPKALPPEKWSRVRMTVYVDANHAHDLVTRRSIIGNLVIISYAY